MKTFNEVVVLEITKAAIQFFIKPSGEAASVDEVALKMHPSVTNTLNQMAHVDAHVLYWQWMPQGPASLGGSLSPRM